MALGGIQLDRCVVELRGWELALALITAVLSVASNMAVGFVVGLGPTTCREPITAYASIRPVQCSYSRRRES